VGVTPAIWRAAADPKGAHDLCDALSSRPRYEHSRGVAQRSARMAQLVRLPADERRLLLAAAWLHDIGYALSPDFHPVVGARALRHAGHEPLARLVAHHSGAAERARMLGLSDITDEFPVPTGPDRGLLDLLDVADLLSGPDGEPITPVARLALMVERKGPDSPSVQMLVQNVNRLGAQPDTRRLIELLSDSAVAA